MANNQLKKVTVGISNKVDEKTLANLCENVLGINEENLIFARMKYFIKYQIM